VTGRNAAAVRGDWLHVDGGTTIGGTGKDIACTVVVLLMVVPFLAKCDLQCDPWRKVDCSVAQLVLWPRHCVAVNSIATQATVRLPAFTTLTNCY
jgi:hypothetical protein